MTTTRRRAFVIRRADQLEVLASPVRQQIVATMERLGPCGARELAEHLGREPEALYYHLRKLGSVGLVREAGQRPSGRRSEAVFALPADDISVDPEGRGPRFLEMVARSAGAILRLAERSYRAALRNPSSKRHGPRRNLWVRHEQVRISGGTLAELNRKLDAVFDFLQENDDPGQERFHSLTIALTPETSGDP